MTKLPLSGWRVLVTRPAEQAQPLVLALRKAGADPILFPTIRVEPPPSWQPFDEAIEKLTSYTWVVFTSPSAVRAVLVRVPSLAADLNEPGAPGIAAVGSQTAQALADRGVPVALVPDDQRQEGLAAQLGASARRLSPGTRVLFPQAVGGRDLLRQELTRAGAVVDVVPVSRTVPVPPPPGPPPDFDVVIFASPSAFQAFREALTAAALRDKIVAVIGPTTHQAITAAGVSVQIQSSRPSVEALVEALVAYRVG